MVADADVRHVLDYPEAGDVLEMPRDDQQGFGVLVNSPPNQY